MSSLGRCLCVLQPVDGGAAVQGRRDHLAQRVFQKELHHADGGSGLTWEVSYYCSWPLHHYTY